MYTENIRKEKSKNLLHKQEVTHFRGRKKFNKGLFNSSLYSDNSHQKLNVLLLTTIFLLFQGNIGP